MAQRLLEHVEVAESSTDHVLRHGTLLQQLGGPSIPSEQARTLSAMSNAFDSISQLISHAHAVARDISSPALVPAPDFQALHDGDLSVREGAYAEASAGHPTLERVFSGPEEARAHLVSIAQDAVDTLASHPERGSALGVDPQELARTATTPSSEDVLAFGSALSEALSWMTPAYLGTTVGERFNQTPPVYAIMAPEFDALEAAAWGSSSDFGGLYVTGSNLIMLASFEEWTQSDRLCLVAHESLHYAAYLGGGMEIRWREEDGNPVQPRYVSWFHEGCTELQAQQLVRDHGHTPSRVAYENETAVAFYLQRLVGTDVLRAAYLSGDFTEVRQRLDARLGAGTFSALLNCENGTEALSTIRTRMSIAHIDYGGWASDPLSGGASGTRSMQRGF
jgi:hypothetical protein